MSLKVIKGDLFSLEGSHILCHGVNVDGKMGAGIAVQFRDRYPDMYVTYDALCRRRLLDPGDIMPWNEVDRFGNEVHICNIASQDRPGANARLEWLYEGMRRAVVMSIVVDKPMAVPMIGAGIGGLDAHDVHRCFRHFQYSTDITVVEYAPVPPVEKLVETPPTPPTHMVAL